MQRVPHTPDSYFCRHFLQLSGVSTDELWQHLLEDAPWVERGNPVMLYRGNELKRAKFFLMCGDRDKYYKYGYPGFQWKSMEHYGHIDDMPLLQQSLAALRIDDEPLQYNHLIGTLYSKATDEIGPHSDRLDDIQEDTDILSLSLGDSREFELTAAGISHKVLLQDGDLFILGPETNATMKHAVLPPSRDRYSEFFQRISIVLRQIKTEMTLEEVECKVAEANRSKIARDDRKGV